MSDAPFCRPLALGVTGDDVIAYKRALSRWDPHVYPWGKFTPFYGPHFQQAVKEFEHRHKLPSNGKIAKPVHDALLAALAPDGRPAFDKPAVDLLDSFCAAHDKTPEETARDAIVAAAFFWYSNRVHIAYSQFRPMAVCKPPHVPDRWDCSGFATNCYHAGGAPDPNGRGYDGLGYTGTLISHGTVVAHIQDVKPGDLIFYGYTAVATPAFRIGDPTHVAVYVGLVKGIPSVVSNGGYPMGLYPWNYRPVNHIRSYPVT